MIRDIPIRVHWSLAVVLVYFAWVFSLRFGRVTAADEWNFTLLAWGLVVAAALFLGVLLHELGHAFTARAFGARVSSITLMFFGGISEIPDMPRRGWREAAVAAVGPGVSFLLAGLGYLVWRLAAPAVSPSADLALALFWEINLVLGIFNLLPAFPLDGGRVLRSLLSRRMGRLRATEVAARVGQGFALLFGLLAIFGNLVLLVIAFLVWMMAEAELRTERLRQSLAGLRARDLVDPEPLLVVPATATAQEVVEEMAARRRVLFLVTDGARITGVVVAGDIGRMPSEARERLRAGEIARAVPILPANLPAEEAVMALERESAAVAAVSDDGHLVGVLTPEHVMRIYELAALAQGTRRRWPGQPAPAPGGG